ncbi:phage head closure protein [Pediococcus pentosaceus]|uniref:Phage head closure protein n=1 Tax=Pediococcus pentosaceus TaxID=1255 RepID=A0AB73HI19_PEDPE|nr:phage head closure protein [Pediococcus pentosaceus]MBF7115176.1 phage head closure protein [Pediococcus pentosaceus]MCM6817914.1 phage head closure protein [Pediococcus pentosaceus]MDN3207338.1 phage head closure protein [Pediococcus pentosaceus]
MMAAMKFKPSDFNRRIAFGKTKDELDKSGNFYVSTLMPELSLWCAPRTRTLNQQYQIMKTELEDTIIVVIRHNPKVNETYEAEYRDELYDIVSISTDDTNQTFAYDFITLKKVKKAGV